MSKYRVLVVEDDTAIRRGIVDALRFANFEVVEAADGAAGILAAVGGDVDLVLLDLILPQRDGFEVLAEIRRAKPQLAVIMLTARGAGEDRVRGLRGGADDYVVKPFDAEELLARITAVLRRSPQRVHLEPKVVLGLQTVDFDRAEIDYGNGERMALSDKEGKILRCLLSARGRPVSRDELLAQAWGLDPKGIQTRTVDMHIARLRDKLRTESEQGEVIITVRSKGYMIDADLPDGGQDS